jgi:hypothetical protein
MNRNAKKHELVFSETQQWDLRFTRQHSSNTVVFILSALQFLVTDNIFLAR